jgi:hypothetical protein
MKIKKKYIQLRKCQKNSIRAHPGQDAKSQT